MYGAFGYLKHEAKVVVVVSLRICNHTTGTQHKTSHRMIDASKEWYVASGMDHARSDYRCCDPSLIVPLR